MNRSTLSDIAREALEANNLDLPWDAAYDAVGAYFRVYIDGDEYGRSITLYDTEDADALIDVSDSDTLDVLLESIERSAYPHGVARDCDDGYVRMYYAGTETDFVANFDATKDAFLDTLSCFFSLCHR